MRLAAILASMVTVAALPASAVNLVQNGGFEQSTFSGPHQFGARYGGANSVTGWSVTNPNAYDLWLNTSTATTVSPVTQYGNGVNSATDQDLWKFTPGQNGGNFVVLDGDPAANGLISQTINGLVSGQTYAVSFEWAAGQLQSRTGNTTESLQVSLGSDSQTTKVVNTPSQGFVPWMNQTFDFTASGASETLSFLSIGTPSGMPPVALLDGVSLSAVPEPASWAMMVIGVGMMGATQRHRRSQRLAVAA